MNFKTQMRVRNRLEACLSACSKYLNKNLGKVNKFNLATPER